MLERWRKRLTGRRDEGGRLEPLPVLHIGRCGSTVLERMVHQHSRVFADGEVFHDTNSPLRGSYKGLGPVEYLSRRQADVARENGGARVYTFEVKFLPGMDLQHFGDDPAQLVAAMHDLGVRRAVLLDRRNVLRRLVSTLLAVKRGQYHARPGDTVAPATVKVPLDQLYLGRAYTVEGAIEAAQAGYRDMRGRLQDAGIEVAEIIYEEDLMQDPFVGCRKFLSFAGLEPEACEIPLQRTQTADLSDIVENYEALAARLGGTTQEWMLTAP